MRVYNNERRLARRVRTLEHVERTVQRAVLSGEAMWTPVYLKLRLKHLRAVNAMKDTRATLAALKRLSARFSPRLRQKP
eukprot:14722468-Alexandrium_andersonii.AAC.1